MRRVLPLCVLFALVGWPAQAAFDPADKFLDAYFLIQQGDDAERASDWTRANDKYAAASQMLGEIKAQAPEWNPHIIAFRLRYCGEHAESLKPKQEKTPPQVASHPAEAEQIRRLELSRNELNDQLHSATTRLQTATTTVRKNEEIIRQLRKENALLQVLANRKDVASGPSVTESSNPRTENKPDLVSCHEPAFDENPSNVIALLGRGAALCHSGRLDEAETVLRKVVAIAPNDSASRGLLGVIFFRKGKREDAFDELARAVALDPRNAEAHNYLGVILADRGWAASAEQEIRRALELNPQYADAHFNLAIVSLNARTPKLDNARYHYRRAIDLGVQTDPKLEAVLNSLAKQTTETATPTSAPKPQP